MSWKYSKTFSAKNLSQPQIIDILDIFKVFSACKIVLAATHQYSGNVQKLFRLQNCCSRKSAISWKHSKVFPPAKISQPQTICILEIFKDFFGCKNVLVATHQISLNIQRLFRLQKRLSRKTSISWKNSKTFSPANLSSPQIIDILEILNDFFACKNFLAATHHYSEKIQRVFRLQNCLSRKSSISWKYSKTFSAAKMSQPQIINIQEYSKTFSAANLSQPQIIYILEIFKDFFACKLVLAANHRHPGNIQRLFRLQNCLSRKLSKDWKYSKTFSPAKLSQQQPIKILKILKDSIACKIVLPANHRYPGNIRRLFRLQNYLSSNPSKT